MAELLAEPDYRWQHRFPSLLGDAGTDGRRQPLPVDGYFPRHRLIVEYWERQHSAPVAIMDEGPTLSGVSRGDQRRLYDQRRQGWADANGLRLLILDYRGFETDERGRLRRGRAATSGPSPMRCTLRASLGSQAGYRLTQANICG